MSNTRLELPPLELGRNPTFLNANRLNLPAGKFYHHTPRLAKPYQSYYINKGISSVNINPGTGPYTDLPLQFRSSFLFNGGHLQGVAGGRPWSQFTVAEGIAAADNLWASTGGYMYFTHGMSEPRFDNDPFTASPAVNLPAFKAMSKRYAQLCEQSGGKNFNDYGGVHYPAYVSEIPAYRTALQSPANAMAFLAARPFMPYFNQSGWLDYDCLLNHYFRSATNLHAKFHHTVGANVLCQMALDSVASTRHIMSFIFGVTEFVDYPNQGYSEQCITELGDGIYYVAHYFPDYSPTQHVDEAFYGLAIPKGGHIFTWDDTLLFSDTPGAKITPNSFREGDNFPMRVQRDRNAGNAIVTTKPSIQASTPFRSNVEYPRFPVNEDSVDLCLSGAKLYELAEAHIGNAGNQFVAGHRTPGAATFCTSGLPSLADRLEDSLPTVFAKRNNGVAWVRLTDNVSEDNGPIVREVDLGGGWIEAVTYFPNANNLFLCTL